jgi:hypothetical protein
MPSPLTDATAGAIGSVLANTLVFPLDVIKTRMQVDNKKIDKTHSYKSPIQALMQIIRDEGMIVLAQ